MGSKDHVELEVAFARGKVDGVGRQDSVGFVGSASTQ